MTVSKANFLPLCVRFSLKSLSLAICTVFFLFAAFGSAQVAITANLSPYPFEVLPGSTRQINVQIAGGTLNTVNWSVLSVTGGATATFNTVATGNGQSSISAGLATVEVDFGPTAGNCSISGSMGAYVISSTATVTVQAQSVDNTAKTANFLFNVCAKTTTVMVAPAYQQAYQGQHRMLQSWVSGDMDETGTWSIISQPTGGNAVLADTNFRDADFVATITGRYTLEYTSNSNASQSATAIVYVSPNPMPNYATTSTPNQTEPRECYPDPALTGADYEVGAGKAYTTLTSTPAIASWTPGTIMRIWNTDTTGNNPSTFLRVFPDQNSGTPTQPIIVCGVPDSLGNLPILDGNNAVGQSGISTGAAASYGIISTWAGPGVPYNYWQAGHRWSVLCEPSPDFICAMRELPILTFLPPAARQWHGTPAPPASIFAQEPMSMWAATTWTPAATVSFQTTMPPASRGRRYPNGHGDRQSYSRLWRSRERKRTSGILSNFLRGIAGQQD